MVSHRITIVTFLMGTFAATSLRGQSTSFGPIAGTSFVIESGSNTVEFEKVKPLLFLRTNSSKSEGKALSEYFLNFR